MTVEPGPDADVAYCVEQLRESDRDRYLSLLLAPADARAALSALYAFRLEVAKTHAVVSEPMLGQIRLQWWRESIDGLFAGTPRRHAVLTPLAGAVRERGLPRAPFDAVIDAHERDLDLAPFPDSESLERYCTEVEGSIVALAFAILGGPVEGARLALAQEAGRAIGMAGLLRRLAPGRRSGPLAIPAAVASAQGLDPDDLRRVSLDDGRMRASVEAVAGLARRRLSAARALRRAAGPRDCAALLPLTSAGGLLRRLSAARFHAADPRVVEPAPGEMWRLALASLLRRF